MQDYIIIVEHAVPQLSARGNTSSYTAPTPPEVKRVRARSPRSAVEHVTVPAGGHAIVVPAGAARRFDRARTAPLVEKNVDGRDLPVATAPQQEEGPA